MGQSDGLVDDAPEVIAAQRRLVKELGGTFHAVAGDDVGEAILDFARGVNATQIVIGTSRHGALRGRFSRGIGEAVAAGAGDIDVHLVGHRAVAVSRRRPGPRSLSRRRRFGGWLLAVLGVVALSLLLVPTRGAHDLPLEVLLYLALTVGCALLGGVWPSVVCAIGSSLVINWFFTDPVGTLTISSPQNALALLVFVVVAVSVASVVHLAARRTRQAVEAQHESRTLATLASSLISASDPVTALLDEALTTFAMRGAALVTREGVREPWQVVGQTGEFTVDGIGAAAVRATVDETTDLVLLGPVLPADEQGLVSAFATHAASVLTRRRLLAEAGQAKGLAREGRARTALLAAVSHDLRTPLAGIKAAVSSLRQDDVTFSPEDEAELLRTVEESADRLDVLIGNLLDMSRLQTGAITPTSSRCPSPRPCAPSTPGSATPAGCVCSSTREPRPSSPTPGCSTGCWRTSSRTPCATPPAAGRCWSSRVGWATGCRCGSSTADRGSPRTRRSASSRPSSARATPHAATESGWGWPSPAVSPS